jgi:replicative DNA helicase
MPITDIIFTSDQLSKQHVATAKKIQSEPGFRWGIPAVDRHIIPARGGDVAVILGRPGGGKTTTLCYLAYHESQQILPVREGHKTFYNETVVFVAWENTVDKIYASIVSGRGGYTSTDYYWGRVPIEDITMAAITRGVIPITFIGFSPWRQTGYKTITLDMILEAIEAINEGAGTPKMKVRAILMDYLQLIPVPGTQGRTESTSAAVIDTKRLGSRLDIPVIAAAQAGRQVDSYQVKLAGPADGQHSSTIEQHVDYGYSIWRPISTEPYDPRAQNMLNIFGRRIELTPTLLIMKNWKQRGDGTGMWWPLYMRPELIQLAEMEIDIDQVPGG